MVHIPDSSASTCSFPTTIGVKHIPSFTAGFWTSRNIWRSMNFKLVALIYCTRWNNTLNMMNCARIESELVAVRCSNSGGLRPQGSRYN